MPAWYQNFKKPRNSGRFCNSPPTGQRVRVTSQSIDSNELIPEPGMPVAENIGVPPLLPACEVETDVDSERFPLSTPDFLDASTLAAEDDEEQEQL